MREEDYEDLLDRLRTDVRREQYAAEKEKCQVRFLQSCLKKISEKMDDAINSDQPCRDDKHFNAAYTAVVSLIKSDFQEMEMERDHVAGSWPCECGWKWYPSRDEWDHAEDCPHYRDPE